MRHNGWFVHLGQGVCIRTKDIVGVFDLDNASVQKKTRDTLRLAEEDGRIRSLSDELPKSFCICAGSLHHSPSLILLSPYSSSTLRRRLEDPCAALITEGEEK